MKRFESTTWVRTLMRKLCAGSIWYENTESIRHWLGNWTFDLTVGRLEGTLWIVKMKVKSESKLTSSIDALHAPFDQSIAVGRKQRFVVSALELSPKSRNVDRLPQISHLESLVSIRNGHLNEDEFFKVRFGRRVRPSNLPLILIDSRSDLGFVDTENDDPWTRHGLSLF